MRWKGVEGEAEGLLGPNSSPRRNQLAASLRVISSDHNSGKCILIRCKHSL